MAMVILNATSAQPGRLPDGWQLKVKPRHHRANWRLDFGAETHDCDARQEP